MKFIKCKERKITMLHFCRALTCLNVSVSHTTSDELQPTPKTPNTRSREFQKHWKVQCSWLENDEEEGMFCKLCRAYPQVTDKTSTFFIGSLRAGIQYRIEPIRSHSGSKSHEACVLKSMFSSNVEQANCKLKTELIWDYLTKMTMPARILSQPLQNKWSKKRLRMWVVAKAASLA